MVRINIRFNKGRQKQNKRLALRRMKIIKLVQRDQQRICKNTRTLNKCEVAGNQTHDSSLGNGDMFVQSAPGVKDEKPLCLVVSVTCSKCTQGHSLIVCNFCVTGCSLYSFFFFNLSPSILHYLRGKSVTLLQPFLTDFFICQLQSVFHSILSQTSLETSTNHSVLITFRSSHRQMSLKVHTSN